MRPVLDRRRGPRDRRARTADRAALRLRRRTPSGRSTPTARLWMLQSRPVTIGRRRAADADGPTGESLRARAGRRPGRGQRRGARRRRARGRRRRSGDGEVLVTHMTAPDWVPLMRRAAAIVTDSGGMTCHAAIVSRELGIPCVVGTGDATTQAARRRARHRRRHARARCVEGAAPPRARAARPAPAAAAGARAGAVTGDPAARQPLRALAGRARRRARRRRRRPAARRADGARGARGRAPAAARSSRDAASEFVDRMADAADRLRRPASRRGRSPTARSTSAPTSSAASRAASASSPRRPTR